MQFSFLKQSTTLSHVISCVQTVSVVIHVVKVFKKSSLSWRLVDLNSRAIVVDIDTTIYHHYLIWYYQISIVMVISDKNRYFQVYPDAAQSLEIRKSQYFA